ncbi:hypothetical protein, partial [Duncaniella muris]|uniref:hypothetical protein n=1 Tax=Duncaniella muris TaxID=2094150 RepID=UPI00261F8D57
VASVHPEPGSNSSLLSIYIFFSSLLKKAKLKYRHLFCYFFCFHRNLRDRRDRSPLSLTDYRSKRRILEIDRDRFFYRVEDLTLVLLRYVANISMFSRCFLDRRGGQWKTLQRYNLYLNLANFSEDFNFS